MFIVAALYCMTNGITGAAPIPNPAVDLISFNSTSAPDLIPSTSIGHRSVWDILWSCLATIIACTWVSVHPNIPGPMDGKIRMALFRLELMFWAIVTPEMIIFWAMRQWHGARVLAKTFENHGWTISHGHFLQMGGFMLVDGDDDIRVLKPDSFRKLVARKEIELPRVSEKDIQDRSKGDGLSKGLVVAQTSWFIAQCISRKAQGLTITEIELATVAFAFLNGIMYFLWWNKPVDVTSCVRVQRLMDSTPSFRKIGISHPSTAEHNPHPPSLEFAASHSDSGHTHSTRPRPPPLYLNRRTVDQVLLGDSDSPPRTPSSPSSLPSFSSPTSSPPLSPLPRFESGAHGTHPKDVFMLLFSRLDEMRGHGSRHRDLTRMPMFFACENNGYYAQVPYYIIISIISTFFGLIHVIGWSLNFPSSLERLLWRSSAVVISAAPFIVLFIYSIVNTLLWLNRVLSRRLSHYHTLKFATLLWKIFLSFIPIYILARLVLLVEAFITLRNLPHGAYIVVNWTAYLPHI